MKCDPEFNIRFVKLVENYPQLYNNTVESYTNKQEVERAWSEISQILNESVANCMSKWTTLRNNLNRSLRAKQRTKIYYLAKYMLYILPFLKARNHTQYYDDLFQDEKLNSQDADYNDEQTKFNPLDIETSVASELEDDISLQEESFQSRSEPETKFSQKRKAKSTISHVDDDKRPRTEYESNNDMEFFQSLLPLLEKLDSYSEKIQFRINVLQTLQQLVGNKEQQIKHTANAAVKDNLIVANTSTMARSKTRYHSSNSIECQKSLVQKITPSLSSSSRDILDNGVVETCCQQHASNEFVTFGNCIATQLQNMPFDVALQLQSDIQALTTKKRLSNFPKILSISSLDPTEASTLIQDECSTIEI